MMNRAEERADIMLDFFGEMKAHEHDVAVLSVLICIGLFECLFGLKFFRPTLFIMGFCSGFIFASSIAANHLDSDDKVYMAAGISGLVLGLAAVAIVGFGLALLGVVLAAAITYACYVMWIHDISDHEAMFYAAMTIAALVGAFI